MGDFQDSDLRSGMILNNWLRRCGVRRTTILKEINNSKLTNVKIGEKSFQQWTSNGESSRRISATSKDEIGNRLIILVDWFFKEHEHRHNPIITTEELQEIIEIYKDIPIKNKLQLSRYLHDLEIINGGLQANLPIYPDWKSQLESEPLCAFVMDDFWCIRATTHYELAFAGFNEEDLNNWESWHRLLASTHGIPKYKPGSPMSSSRGPYAKEYYARQMIRFRLSTSKYKKEINPRYQTMMKLLQKTPGFQDIFDYSLSKEFEEYEGSIGFPVPFFRADGTLLWMIELHTVISERNNLKLILWEPLNKESGFYMADFIQEVDQSGRFLKKVFFVEDYASSFSKEQRFVLGLD